MKFIEKLDSKLVEQLIKKSGITTKQFTELYWDNKSHQTINYFDRAKNITMWSLVKICLILDLSPNEVLFTEDYQNANPTKVGQENAQEIHRLQLKITELETRCTMLTDENTELRALLRHNVETLVSALQPGQNSDK